METQNMIRKAVTKITAMLMSAIYLAVSVNVPVLAQDVSGPITRDTYEGDVAVTAGHIFDDNMAGVYATDTGVSVGNNLSVTSNTDPNVNDNNVTGVYVTGAEVSVGNNLSVDSERKYTKGIYANPNAITADVTIGNNLTVASNNTDTGASTTGIEAHPAASGTAKIKVGNPLTNQGDVTVTGTVEVMGIKIANNSSNNQDNTNITVGGDVKSSISGSNGGSAKGVSLGSGADGAETNVDIGGAVDATGSREAMGLEIKPTAHNTNEIYVGKGISASAAKATGVYVSAQNTSNAIINIGKDSSGNAITVQSNGDNNDQAFSSGIKAQLQTGEVFTGSTTATINVEGNIVVGSEAAGAHGIYADGGDRTNLNVQVKGDVTSNGAGIYTKDMSSAELTDIIIDGTVKSTADNIPAVILDESSINSEDVSITAWKIESNEDTALLGTDSGTEIQPREDIQESIASHISYIIRVTQPEINNTPVNVISLANADGTAWNTKKAWNNGERAEPTMLEVAGEGQKVYVNLDVPDGYQIVGVYADAEKTVAFSQDENGSYFLDVPRGGGIDVNVDLKPADPVVPADIRVTGVKLDKTTAVLDKGDTVKLTAKVIPDNATNKKVTWKSDKEGVARVDQNGTVTAVEEGAATITVTTEDGGYTDTCKVTVKKDNSDPEPEPVKTYTIRVKTEGKGTATADPTNTRAGQKVIIKATSKAGYKFKKWTATNGVSLKDAKKASTSFIMPDKDVTVKAIFEKIYDAPQPELEPVDDNKILLSWQKVDGAKGYDIFMSRDNKGVTPKLVKTIEGNKTFKWTATGLKPRKSYKALIKAYVKDKKGKKQYISESPLMYVFTAGGNKTYTNAKSVKLNTSDGKIKKNKLTLKVKDTYKIKASVKKADKKKKLMPASHVKTLRYRSSDTGIATVSSKGKITAKKKGKCNIYVYAHNGVNKTIKLTVK